MLEEDVPLFANHKKKAASLALEIPYPQDAKGKERQKQIRVL